MLRKLVPSTRYAVLLVVAVVLAAVFVRLGFWQLHRLHERRAFKTAVLSAERAPVRPLRDVVSVRSDPDRVAYRRVEVRGHYDVGDEVILYGRSLHEQPGNHVLTPLVTSGGRAVLVDRGWVPIEMDHPPVARASPPAGPVRVTGLLLPPEASSSGSGKVTLETKVDLTRIAAGLRYPVYPVYLQLQSQDPPQPGKLPQKLPPPNLSGGPPNLSYAIQWFSFAVIALVGYVILALRKERPDGSSETAPRPEPARRSRS